MTKSFLLTWKTSLFYNLVYPQFLQMEREPSSLPRSVDMVHTK
jgi:hypothetical protein